MSHLCLGFHFKWNNYQLPIMTQFIVTELLWYLLCLETLSFGFEVTRTFILTVLNAVDVDQWYATISRERLLLFVTFLLVLFSRNVIRKSLFTFPNNRLLSASKSSIRIGSRLCFLNDSPFFLDGQESGLKFPNRDDLCALSLNLIPHRWRTINYADGEIIFKFYPRNPNICFFGMEWSGLLRILFYPRRPTEILNVFPHWRLEEGAKNRTAFYFQVDMRKDMWARQGDTSLKNHN